MDIFRHQFFSGAGSAGDQDGGIHLRHIFCSGQNGLHHFTDGDHLGAVAVLLRQRLMERCGLGHHGAGAGFVVTFV